MHCYRARFKDEIVAEFLPPFDPETEEVNSDASREVVIFLPGMPSVPDQQELVKYFAARDFWCILPRYRGSWESDGVFLEQSPVHDLANVIDGLYEQVTEVYEDEQFYLDPQSIHVIGSSFGGGVALEAAAELHMIDKTIALSPVVDWKAQSDTEPIDHLKRFVERGFGNGYRAADDGWSKLQTGALFNPIDTARQTSGEDILIIYSTDDTVVALPPIEEYIKKSACNFHSLEEMGHLGGSDVTEPPISDTVMKFFSE